MNPLNKHFDNIYLLYIDQEEVNKVKNKLKKHNIKVQYFKGVNGKRELVDKYRNFKNKSRVPTIGAFGHLHSFINILEDALEKNYNRILILEADIYFCYNFEDEVKKYLNMDYQILQLGCSQHVWNNINIKKDYYYPCHLTCGTFALGLDKSVFLDYLNILKKFEKPSDVSLFEIYKKYDDKCIVAYPNLICCDVTTSNICNKRSQTETMEKFRWIRKYEFEEEFDFKVEDDKWYKLSFYISDNFGYKTGTLNIRNEKEEIFPELELPNYLFSEKKINIKKIEDLDGINRINFCLRTRSEKINLKFRNIFIRELKINKVNKEIVTQLVNVWELRKNYDLTFINYYKKNLMIKTDSVFDDRFHGDRELFLDKYLFDKFIQNLRLELPEKKDSERKLKVMYLVNYSPQYESIGYTIRTHNLLKNTIDKNIDITVVTRYGYPFDKNETYFEDNTNEFNLENITYDKLINRKDNRNNYNLVDYLKVYIVEAIKYAWVNNIDIVHSASDFWNGIVAVYVAKFLKIKSIYEIRGLWEESAVTFKPFLYKSDMLRMRTNMEVFVCNNVDRVLTINENLKDSLINKGVNKDIKIIPNGVDTSLFKPSIPTASMIKQKIPKNKYDLIIGYIGTIIEYEGLEYIIRTLNILKNNDIKCLFILVGKGNYLDDLIKLAKSLDVYYNILYLGKKDHRDVIDLYNIFDLVIYPRKDLQVCRTTASSKIFESMAMQKCIIVSDLPAWREVLEDNNTGLLFKPDDVKDLVYKINKIVKNHKKRINLGKRARCWVIRNRSWKTIGLDLKEIYASLLQ